MLEKPRPVKPRLYRNRLRVLRAEFELTQRDMSVLIPMSIGRYFDIEKGLVNPTFRERIAIAHAFKVGVDDLGCDVPPADDVLATTEARVHASS